MIPPICTALGRRPHLSALVAGVWCAISITLVHAGEIEPRPGVTFSSTALTVKSVSKAGVQVQSGSSAPAWLGWDRVKSITGAHASEAAAFISISDRLWRLRLRAERDDLVLAEPLADELVQELSDAPGPSLTAALATQLACRLRRGARTAAVDSWLKWLEASSDRSAFFADAGPTDPALAWLSFDESGLTADLHPFWLDSPAVRAFAQRTIAEPRDKATRLAWLYAHAAAFECGDRSDAATLTLGTGEAAAVALVNEIVTARVADAASRQRARTLLAARLSAEPGGWKGQWILAGIGRSLLRETSKDQKLLGVDALLQVAGNTEQPVGELAAMCLAESIVALFDLGEVSGASSLKTELFQRFNTSPVLSWPPLKKVPGNLPAMDAAAEAAAKSTPPGTGGTP
jgi:hypothetical protein